MLSPISPAKTPRPASLARLVGWTTIAGLLLYPAVAMQFTDEVKWTISDFVIAGVFLIGVGGLAELAAKASGSWSYRLGAGLAILGSAVLIWLNGAVGIIGSEDHPANLLYLGVIIASLLGAIASRFRASGLSLTMALAAVLHPAIGVIAIWQGWGKGSENWPRPVIVLGVAFALIWLASAGLFHRAAKAQKVAASSEDAGTIHH